MTAREIALLVLGMLAGACVGSFANVVIARLPRHLDEPNEYGELWETNSWREVLGGESRCAGCARRLGPLDMVPVLSWLVLRGRCRSCGAHIPAYHPLVELVVPLLGVLAWHELGWGWPLATVLWLVPAGVAVAVIDLRTFMVPTRIVWPAFGVLVALTVVGSIVESHPRWLVGALTGCLVMSGPLAVIWFVFPSGMGFGDVRLAVLAGWTVGFVAGAPGDAAVLAAMSLGLAAVFGIVLGVVALGARGRTAKVPFGPAILLAVYTSSILAPRIVDQVGAR